MTKLTKKKEKPKSLKVKTNKVLKIEEESNLKKVHYNKGQSKLGFKYWKNIFLDKYRSTSSIIVNMELRNGLFDTLFVGTSFDGFKYKDGLYIIDDELKYYNTSFSSWCFDYHQDFTLPVKRKVPINTIKTAMESSGISEVEYATNPSTLERFIISKIAEGVMKGQAMDEEMKRQRLLLIITMISSVLMLLLFVFKTGMLQSISIPGFG